MTKEFVFAGFGGQGVLTAGMILAYSGAAKDLDVTWIPSYGSEMRGGTANCTVKLGDEEVASPFPKAPDVLIAMNEPAGVKVYSVPANDIAADCKNERSANLCALGAAIAAAGDLLTLEDVEKGLCGYLAKIKNNESNIAVLKAGYRAVSESA